MSPDAEAAAVDPGAADTLNWVGAGERDRIADLPFTRSTALCTVRASCADDKGNRTDGISCAGIILRVVPRTVHADGRQEPTAVTERSGQKAVEAIKALENSLGWQP